MISPLFSPLLLPFIIAMFLAITMGGSGTGPAFSAAYGANVLRKSLIPGLFGIMVFLGAILAGKGTATTIGKELFHYWLPIYLVFRNQQANQPFCRLLLLHFISINLTLISYCLKSFRPGLFYRLYRL